MVKNILLYNWEIINAQINLSIDLILKLSNWTFLLLTFEFHFDY